MASLDASEIKEIYKSVIGSISENEKSELVEWCRNHEKTIFMNIIRGISLLVLPDYMVLMQISYML